MGWGASFGGLAGFSDTAGGGFGGGVVVFSRSAAGGGGRSGGIISALSCGTGDASVNESTGGAGAGSPPGRLDPAAFPDPGAGAFVSSPVDSIPADKPDPSIHWTLMNGPAALWPGCQGSTHWSRAAHNNKCRPRLRASAQGHFSAETILLAPGNIPLFAGDTGLFSNDFAENPNQQDKNEKQGGSRQTAQRGSVAVLG